MTWSTCGETKGSRLCLVQLLLLGYTLNDEGLQLKQNSKAESLQNQTVQTLVPKPIVSIIPILD